MKIHLHVFHHLQYTLLYKIVNEELEKNLPKLPQYISDGLDWLEEKLGGN